MNGGDALKAPSRARSRLGGRADLEGVMRSEVSTVGYPLGSTTDRRSASHRTSVGGGRFCPWMATIVDIDPRVPAWHEGSYISPGRRVAHSHSDDEERRIRERALDQTLAGTFPASDPPSSLPNPDDDSVDTDSVSNEPEDVAVVPPSPQTATLVTS